MAPSVFYIVVNINEIGGRPAPAVYKSEDPHEELRAYIGVYLKEEIQQEGWVRSLPPFSRFLTAAAATSGERLNYAAIGSHEVDVLIGDHTAIELKASRKVSMRDARGLIALREEKHFRNYIVVSTDPSLRQEDGILFLPWQEFLKRLWDNAWG